MKKLRKIAAVMAVMIMAVCFIAACGKPQSLSGTMTLVIGTETPAVYTVDLDNVEITKGVFSVLEYLKETEELDYAVEESTFGAFLTKVGAIEQDSASGTYIYIYTSVEKDFDVSAYVMTIEYDGTTLKSSGLGVSEMTIEKDCIIYIGTIAF